MLHPKKHPISYGGYACMVCESLVHILAEQFWQSVAKITASTSTIHKYT